MNLHKVLKFLFPEVQIIEHINNNGFTAKSSTKSTTSSRYSVEQNYANNQVTRQQTHSYGNQNSSSNNNVYHKLVYSGNRKLDIDNNQINEAINSVKTEVVTEFVGQATAIEALLVAFKRPFVFGIKDDVPRNTFFLIGNENIGKNYLLNTTIAALLKRKLLNYETANHIDLGIYPTQSEKDLFLSDLYKALYVASDVIIFSNFDKCYNGGLEIISNLVITGKHQLGARYTMQNNNLIESSGVLMQNSISEISANNKYFIFTTDHSEKKISDIFGSKFMKNISDIIVFDSYNESEILAITKKILYTLNQRCSKQFRIELRYSASFTQFCASKYKKATGLKQIDEFVTDEVYKALSEYKLRRGLKANATVYLNIVDGAISAIITENSVTNKVDMSEFFPEESTILIDDVKKELSEVIGLSKVKDYVLDLENNLKVQRMREEAGFKSTSLSMHMIFAGNPGTGKTMIARIVAKYLKAIGVLSVGKLVEVSRSDLVGQYVGHTANLTNSVIKSALGGVLFIDEAYALCRDKNDVFGLEAIDALVKAIEDYRDDLVVILAGYSDEMDKFFNMNPGLKSRFPNKIDFEDYSAPEMVEIAAVTAKSKGYKIDNSCNEDLLKLFEKSQIKGRNDSGNARLVRNVIESAILEQSNRVLNLPNPELDILIYDDFEFERHEQFDLEKSLSTIIGLNNVKDFVRTQQKLLIANEKRRNAGIKVDSTQSLNMIFAGNPGTGKTTIARVVAKMFKEMGVLKSGHLVEVDQGDLVAEYVGQTSKKTEEVFRSALGGVLFIDEAYALNSANGGFAKEAIDTLVKLIEDYRGEILVILAGYKKEMADFMKTNSGLESRFPLVIDFSDYTPDELNAIALDMISKKGFTININAKSLLFEQIYQAHKSATANSGNGRMIRNLIEEIMRKQSSRIALDADLSKESLTEILPEDIEINSKVDNNYDLERALASVVGLTEVKDYVRSLYARLRMQSERKKLGLQTDNSQTLHMIFKGNPGTGKTMIARTIADVLYNIGVIKTNKIVETDRAGLVAGYVGQTAIKTSEKIMEAMDGILFIDEAYSLSQGGENDFGREAIDTLVKMMDDNRERLVVILAGYNKNMETFLLTNPGLKSRFPNVIEFNDYTSKELVLIADQLYSSKGYILSEKANEKLVKLFEKVQYDENFGNGRYVRNVFERSVNNQALRLNSDPDLTREELSTIEDSDIEEV